MKFYVITKGSYSDYHIITVTASEEKAIRLKMLYTDDWGEPEIEEYEEASVEDNRLPYSVWEGGYGRVIAEVTENWQPTEIGVIKKWRNGTLEAIVLANNAEHAKKIFYDLKAEYLARKNGVD